MSGLRCGGKHLRTVITRIIDRVHLQSLGYWSLITNNYVTFKDKKFPCFKNMILLTPESGYYIFGVFIIEVYSILQVPRNAPIK